MGVRGLWKVIEPSARPISLDELRGKVLAIDASIWIYHFIKAMRDSKGSILRAAHVVGFFRRICKLLFYEIKAVFVFDGAAPTVKKLTTARRQHRRQGREYNARATANKLLTLQLQKAANTQQQKSQADDKNKPLVIGTIPQNTTYHGQHSAVKPENKPFQPMDQYHLPQIDSIAPVRLNDQRLLTEEELDDYAEQFTNQARAGFIDASTIDFDSSEFQNLPISTRYQLLNTARLKSRLRMGYNTEQLRDMFPDKMEFSRFQIERVAQRNYFAQRVLNMVGFDEDLTRRVSSEKNREYMLKRSDDGWSLSLEENGSGSTTLSRPTLSKTNKAPGLSRTTAMNAENDGTEVIKEDDFEEANDAQEQEPLQEPANPTAVILSDSESDESENDEFVEVDLTLKPEEIKSSAVVSGKETEKSPTSNEVDSIMGFEAQISRDKYLQSLKRPADRPTSSLLFRKKASDSNVPHKPANPESRLNDVPDKSDKAPPQEIPPWFSGSADTLNETMEQRPELESNLVPYELAEDLYDQGWEETRTSKRIRMEDLSRTGSSPTSSALNDESIKQSALDHKPQLLGESTGDIIEDAGEAPIPEPFTLVEVPHETNMREKLVDLTKSPEPDISEKELQVKPTVINLDDEAMQPENQELTREEAELADDEAQADQEDNDDVAEMLIGEAEENERFVRSLNKGTWTTNDEANFQNEITTLRSQFAKESRDADNVTEDMIIECQELLQLFGIPYVTAPTEAEAQCAELQSLKLVDGVVTDDGDCFLFGNVSVYRNMFTQAKFVESYNSDTIKRELGLDRDKLISLALLLGSDYTDGLTGVGPVTSVELLAEFGTLEKFREWWEHAQRFPDETDLGSSFRRRFLKQFASKLFLREDFPDKVVIDSYLKPVIDPDESPFQWGSPDLEGLRTYMLNVAGWSEDATNQVILPVVQETKRLELQNKSRVSQASLDNYVTTTRNLKLGSKRASKATERLREME